MKSLFIRVGAHFGSDIAVIGQHVRILMPSDTTFAFMALSDEWKLFDLIRVSTSLITIKVN